MTTMNSSVQDEGANLIALLQAIRTGRDAQKSLQLMFSLPDSLQKTLRLNWLDALEAASKEIKAVPAGQWSSMAYAMPIVDWFVRCTSDLVNRLFKQLSTLTGSEAQGERMLELLNMVREGCRCEDSFAIVLWHGLRQRTPKVHNLLSPAHSQSDIVQEAVSNLIDWAVEAFHGTTEAELWAAAHQQLTWRANDAGRRPHHRDMEDVQQLEIVQDPESSPSGVLINKERRGRMEAFIDRWPEQDRMLFRLHHVEGLSYPALAALLGQGESHDAVGHRIRTLRAALHHHMREE